MKNTKKTGLKTGTIFSIVSFLLTFTIAIPMFTVMPAIFTDTLILELFPEISYSQSCKISLLVFVMLLLVTLILTKRNIKKSVEQNQQTNALKITFTMLILYFIMHPIGYYIVMWFSGFPVDALNAMMSLYSFPFISLLFVLIGFLMDWYRNKLTMKNG